MARRDFDLWAPLRSHPNWDPVSMRILPTADFLDGLIVRYVGAHEVGGVLCEAMMQLDYNPVDFYPPGYRTMPGEAGHDGRRRYVLLPG